MAEERNGQLEVGEHVLQEEQPLEDREDD